MVEGKFLLPYMLPHTSVCLFDFAGSGHSEGDHITLGVKEERDLGDIIDTLRRDYSIGTIALWGRSMGAVTALLYADKNPDKINGIVLDSPFTHFNKMVGDVVRSQRKIPRCLINCFLCCLVKSAQKNTKVNLSGINPIKIAHRIELPACFLVTKQDILSRPERMKDLFDTYLGTEKEFYLIEGTHQSVRDKRMLEKGSKFIKNVLDRDSLKTQLSSERNLSTNEDFSHDESNNQLPSKPESHNLHKRNTHIYKATKINPIMGDIGGDII